MEFFSTKDFQGTRPWESQLIANIKGITTKLHWTDKAYHWHVNDGEEIFIVMDGKVIMHYIEEGLKKERLMEVGDIFFASIGTEHFAEPQGPAKVLVIEHEGSE